MAITEVLKCENEGGSFIWKHPEEDFNTLSQLIVHESQEAVFFADGKALDLFGPGRYTLDTRNIPLLSSVINIPTGGVSPFHCEVYFINKAEQMAIKWGTDSKVHFNEPTLGFPLAIGASGEMTVAVNDSRKLLLKLVGTNRGFDRMSLSEYFRGVMMTEIKSNLSAAFGSGKIGIFTADEKLKELSEEIKTALSPSFDLYGLSLMQFFVTTVIRPEGDPQYENLKQLYFRRYADVADAQIRQQVGIIEQQTEAQKTVISSEAAAKKRSIEGYTYQQERGFDVAEKAAANEASGQFAGMGIGLGIMSGASNLVGGAVNNAVGAAFVPQNQPQNQNEGGEMLFCDNCGARLEPGSAFCDNCGASLKPADVCSRCGYHFTRPGKFCPKCGERRS